ncbi:15829_t:CDS:1, partial [Gigaspora rosea]
SDVVNYKRITKMQSFSRRESHKLTMTIMSNINTQLYITSSISDTAPKSDTISDCLIVILDHLIKVPKSSCNEAVRNLSFQSITKCGLLIRLGYKTIA